MTALVILTDNVVISIVGAVLLILFGLLGAAARWIFNRVMSELKQSRKAWDDLSHQLQNKFATLNKMAEKQENRHKLQSKELYYVKATVEEQKKNSISTMKPLLITMNE